MSVGTEHVAVESTNHQKMPPGIPYIVGNEAAERFSFYGMKAILFIYMTRYLHDAAGHPDIMEPENARALIHLFVATAYFFPIGGAILSDWLFGKYRTIFWLSLVYCLGHLALAAVPGRFGLLTGLTLIAIGQGGIKPCVSAHVGDQFNESNKHLLPRVFSWFYFSINFGAFISTLIIPILLDKFGPKWGPHIAFGLPGVLMFLATFVFWLGRKKFVHVKPGGSAFLRETFGADGLKALARLIPLYLFVSVFWALYDQTASSWIEQSESMNRNWLGINWLPSQIQAINPILVLILIPFCTYVFYPAMNLLFEPKPLRRVAIGFFLAAMSFSVSAWIESQITGGKLIRSADLPVQENSSATAHELVVQLREHKPWNIRTVSWNPAKGPSDKAEQGFPFKVVVETGPKPKGPWTLQIDKEFQQAATTPFIVELPSVVSAEYVRLQITPLASESTSSPIDWSLPQKIEVTAAESSPPADAHDHAEAVWPDLAAAGHQPSIGWQFIAYLILTLAEVLVSITCLEFSYTQAPNKMKSLIMSAYLLSVSLGNFLTAFVNVWIQNPDGTSKLPGASYYWFFTGMMLVASVGFLAVLFTYREKTYIQSATDAES